MRKKIMLAAQIIFLIILIAPSLAWGILSLAAPGAKEALDYDLGENRNKNPYPESFNAGTYTRELEDYYTDRIPFRSVIITANRRFTGRLEMVYLKQIQPTLAKWLYKEGAPSDAPQDEGPVLAKGKAPLDRGEEPVEEEPVGEKPAEEEPVEEPEEDVIIEDGEHHYKRIELVKPTCEADGKAVYECTDCQEIYTEELSATGHTAEVLKVVEATFLDYGYTEYHCSVCDATYKGDITVKTVDDAYLPATTVGQQRDVLLGRDNWLFYAADDSVSYYKGTNLLSEAIMKDYLSVMIQLQQLCDQRGIRLQFMIMPNKDQVYPEYMPSYKVEQIEKRDDRLVSYIRSNSNVNIIYPLRELKTAKSNWQVYYKYDTHWNYIGAFIGTQALYKALGMSTTDLNGLAISSVELRTGDLLSMGGLDGLLYPADQQYIIDYKPGVQVTEVQGDINTIYYASSDSANQCNLVMLADSYRVQMIPYLQKDFSHITVAHRDYVESLESSIKEADILVLAAVERYDTRMFVTAQTIIDMLEKPEE